MSRTTDLQDLVRNGRLRPGTKLYHYGRRHPDRSIEATVETGGIRLKGRLFTSPSSAAEAVTGQAVNGWIFWRVKATGETLQELRAIR